MSKTRRFLLPLIPSTLLRASLLAVLLASCQPQPATEAPNIIMTAAIETALAQINQPTQTPAPSDTPIPIATIPRTPPALPGTFTTAALKPVDTPHTYIQDTCQYLHDKWDPNNAAPGTIAIVIMFHGINKGEADDTNDITVTDFKKLMESLKELGFEAINAAQLADFLDHNAKIPNRSVVLTYDDRHTAQAFEHFRPYYEQWGWPVINGWISAFGGQDQYLAENVALSAEGWVDYQAHGVVHNTPMGDNSPDDYLMSELQGSITNLQTYFNKTPIAIIWPGGGFGLRPAQVARQLGYRVGFTVNPRGPIMYNWVPLADAVDPGRPAWLAEGPANDPRMTLPRYWPREALAQLDTVRVIGNEAAAYAEQNKAVELEYYDIVCAPTLGALPAPNP
ncbi:MAG: polysaccharide deacetylase family protein [Chloroflexota bacterium]